MSAIHIKSPALTLKAGCRALARIRQHGLSPADVGILPGAAGGPKGLALLPFDRLFARGDARRGGAGQGDEIRRGFQAVQQFRAFQRRAALCDLIAIAPRQHIGQGRFPRSVNAFER